MDSSHELWITLKCIYRRWIHFTLVTTFDIWFQISHFWLETGSEFTEITSQYNRGLFCFSFSPFLFSKLKPLATRLSQLLQPGHCHLRRLQRMDSWTSLPFPDLVLLSPHVAYHLLLWMPQPEQLGHLHNHSHKGFVLSVQQSRLINHGMPTRRCTQTHLHSSYRDHALQ